MFTATISNVAYSVSKDSLKFDDQIDEQSDCSFGVIDLSGAAHFTKNMPVEITDNDTGKSIFAGFVNNQPTAQVLYPNPARLWALTCRDETWCANKRTSNKVYKNQYAGAILVDMVQRYGSPEGLICKAGLRWEELLSDWQQGTLSGTVAATNASSGNPGDGDLELAPAGAAVSIQLETQADFQVGALGGIASPSGGGLTFAPTQAIKLQATESVPGASSAVLKMKIWSGSYTIAAQDLLFFDVWIASTSPQQMATLDLVMSDGTTMSQSLNGVDFNGLTAALNNDLSGLATNTWYTRGFFIDSGGAWVGKTVVYAAVCFGGTSQGAYTAYFRNIYITNGPTGTVKATLFSKTATATQTTPQPVVNSGYSAISCGVVTSYERHGFAETIHYSLSAAGIAQSSFVSWDITLPTSDFSCSITATLDRVTFLPCTLNEAIPGLLPGRSLSGVTVALFCVFDNSGPDPTLTPLLSLLKVGVQPAYACAKSDIVSVTNTQAQWQAGTLTNLVSTGSLIALNGYARNWDDTNFANQTLYGTSSPALGILNKQFYLRSGTGADVRSRLDFAGSNWQNFTAECDFLLPPANAQIGIVYRTTGWQNASNTFAYCCIIQTSGVVLGYGTNTSSGAGAFTNVATSSIALSVGTIYRFKIVVNGNNHQIFINDVNVINANNSTYTGAGYVGLRFWNNTGSTQTAIFDNFGIMAALSGTWVSPPIDIHALGTISNSEIIVQIDPANNLSTSTIQAEISLDNGSTWTTCPNTFPIPVQLGEGYFQCTPVPGLVAGTNVSGMTQVLIRLTITSSTASTGLAMPDIQAVSLTVLGAYSSSGTRSTAPLAWDSMQRADVVGGFGDATDGENYSQAGTGATALTSHEAQISNTTGDVHMQLGSGTDADVENTLRFSLSDDATSAGVELRYSDANNYYRLQATQNSLEILACIRGVQVTLASMTYAITPLAWYWLRFRVTGSGPINFFGRLWPDQTVEPAAWNVSVSQ